MRKDPHRSAALKAIPAGYAVINVGNALPDDLMWSVFEEKWRRQDDPEWLHKSERAEYTICTIRKIKPSTEGYGSVRKYSVSRVPEQPSAEEFWGQSTLFGEVQSGRK